MNHDANSGTMPIGVQRRVVPTTIGLAWLASLLAVLLVVALVLSGRSNGDASASRRGSELVATSTNGIAVRGNAIEVSNTGTDPAILNLGLRPFNAASLGFVIVDAQPLPPGAELALLWVQRAQPNEIREQILKSDRARIVPTPLSDNADWRGEIVSVALGVKNPSDRIVVIRKVDLRPASLRLTLADMFDDWMSATGWNGKSINVVFGGRDEQRVYLPPLAAGAALVACAALGLYARRRRLFIATWVAIPVVASWMLLDLRWQWQLGAQVRETQSTFAGKSLEERHVAMEHPAFFALVQAALRLLPAGHRVFVTSDFEYFRLRAGYYLYPHNVLAFDWADPGVLRAGDYLLMFAKRDVKFDAANGTLDWSGGRRVAVRALLDGVGEGLYEIR